MADILGSVGDQLQQPELTPALKEAADLLRSLLDETAYVGEVFSPGYEESLVQIHDFHRRKVGGIPALSFLLATRIIPSQNIDVREEDSSVILLRVLDHADLPNAQEALRVRVENAQRVSGELDKTWDHRDVMDPTTHHLLSYAGIRCRVLGTFYVREVAHGRTSAYQLCFGSDISNYYPNRGLKVFRPKGRILEKIVNYFAEFVVAIDGSSAEVDVRNGYPGAKVGYCTVASVLLKMREINRLDENRPVDPHEFRKTEEAATIDAALPGSNVVTRAQQSARASFRQELYDLFHDSVFDDVERVSLLDTYHALLALKPKGPSDRAPRCPYEGCDEEVNPVLGVGTCSCRQQKPVFSTDALRIHEGFRDIGTNGEAFGEVMQVAERVLLVHLLRGFERRNLLEHVGKVAFFLDGPLAVFGHPAWLSAAIQKELVRINATVHSKTGCDLCILGIEKTGAFVAHFEEIDNTETPGKLLFSPRSYLLLTDRYIKTRINFSDSAKRYGIDTYFGRKVFYKSSKGARIVATLPFLSAEQDTIDNDDIIRYPQFAHYCVLLDKLTSSRYPNSLAPIISAHAQASIPLSLGKKVLEQLARALVAAH